MKPVRTVPKKASAILLMMPTTALMPSCESAEQSKENEQRQQLSEALDRIERLNLEEVELCKQDFEAVDAMPRKEGFSRRIDKHAQAERKRNGTQKKLAGRTERVNRLLKAIPEGDVMRMAVEIAGMEQSAIQRMAMAERAHKESRGNERERGRKQREGGRAPQEGGVEEEGEASRTPIAEAQAQQRSQRRPATLTAVQQDTEARVDAHRVHISLQGEPGQGAVSTRMKSDPVRKSTWPSSWKQRRRAVRFEPRGWKVPS